MSQMIRVCQVLIILGILSKFYGIGDPWKTHDHYNYGGVWTTTFAECLKSVPLSVSKGVVMQKCWGDTYEYYPNHPPTILFAFWGWTSVFGNAEWAYRLMILVFSSLNILLVFKIGREVERDGPYAWMAAAFQSSFLAGMYFGTHLDFIGEFSVFFVLLTALLALRRQMTAACFMAIAAGISSWPGYLVFAPLFLYACSIGYARKRVVAIGALGFAIALGEMMWFHQTLDIVAFFKKKVFAPEYIQKDKKGLKEIPAYFSNVITSHARLLGPLFAGFAFYEISRGAGRELFTGFRNRWSGLTRFHHAILLSGGTGFFYAIIGHEYVMVHVFLYLFTVPAAALLCAKFAQRFLVTTPVVFSKREFWWFAGITLVCGALYPYGIFKTNVVHDALTSVEIAVSVLAFIWLLKQGRIGEKSVAVFMAAGLVGNFSQTANYRNEPDTQKGFCTWAREEYARTGEVIVTSTPPHPAKLNIYCRDIPIVYGDENAEQTEDHRP